MLVFTNGVETRDVMLDGDECYIPHEVLSIPRVKVRVGVYGTDGENVILPTIWANLGDVHDAPDPSGDETTDPSLPIWGKILADIGDLSDLLTKDKESNGTDQSGANGLSVKAFLLSGYEVGFTTSDSSYFPVDGTKLDYFTAGSGGNFKRIANFNGSPYGWWLRSPYDGNTLSVWYIDTSGRNKRLSSYNSYGVRPTIILPSDMQVADDMLLPSNIKTVSIIGHYFGSGYVMVGETKYSRAIEAFSEIGTTIVAHVGAPDSTGVAGCKIYFNGNLVETGTSSYSFMLKGNTTITFERPDGSTSAIECYIVTQ